MTIITDQFCNAISHAWNVAFVERVGSKERAFCALFIQTMPGGKASLWGKQPGGAFRYEPGRERSVDAVLAEANKTVRPFLMDRVSPASQGLRPAMLYIVAALKRSGAESPLHELHVAYNEGVAALEANKP